MLYLSNRLRPWFYMVIIGDNRVINDELQYARYDSWVFFLDDLTIFIFIDLRHQSPLAEHPQPSSVGFGPVQSKAVTGSVAVTASP